MPLIAVQGQINTGLKPIRHAVRPFRNAVERVIRGDAAGEGGAGQPVRGIVVVQRHVEHPWRCNLRVVDLNLVCLGMRPGDPHEAVHCRRREPADPTRP